MILEKVYDELIAMIEDLQRQVNEAGNAEIWKEIAVKAPVNGDEVVIQDAAAIYATDITAQIDPVQDLHGYDHPWVGGAGKNILPLTVEGIKAANTDGTWSGNAYTIYDVTFTIVTDSDGNVIGINVNGTASGNHANFLLAEDFTLASSCILSGAYDFNMPLRVYDENTVVAEDTGSGANVASGAHTNCRITAFENKPFSNVMVYPMIRLSTETDASFAPYTNICPITASSSVVLTVNGDDVTISLGQSVYGGHLDVSTGVLTVDSASEDMGSLSWSKPANYNGFYASVSGISTTVTGGSLRTSIFKENSSSFAWSNFNGYPDNNIFKNYDQFVYVKATQYSSIDDFETAVNGQQLTYPLDTPTTVQLTPKQIKLLQGLNTISASTGPVTIKYQPDNALGDILGQAQEFALNAVYIAPALDTGDKIADFAIGNNTGVLYETPAPEQSTRRTTKKSTKEE